METFVVAGAGQQEVNGVYARSLGQCDGSDIYRKAGTTYALLRNGTGMWSLADLRNKSAVRWRMDTVELYRVLQIPAGKIPPPVGWDIMDGVGPPPMVHMAKASLFSNFAVELPDDKALALQGRVVPRSSLMRAGHIMLCQSASEPRLPRPKQTFGASFDKLAESQVTTRKAPPSGAGDRKYVCSFRVILSRPSATMPWGIVWSPASFEQTRSRTVAGVDESLPLGRWNIWQKACGRPHLCVAPGDQLVRVDGRWAHHDQVVGSREIDQAREALVQGNAKPISSRIALEFLRPVVRPAVPDPPSLEVWDSQQHLVVNWDRVAAEQVQQVLGWALAICDVDRSLWYVVDSTGHRAMPVGSAGGQNACALSDAMTNTHVWEGLEARRIYAVCVAVLTPRGWSPFSELSRPQLLPKLQGLDTRGGIASPPQTPGTVPPSDYHFAVPVEVVPGATAPVELGPAEDTFLELCRHIRLRTTLKADSDSQRDLEMEASLTIIGYDAALLVGSILPGSSVFYHNEEQRRAGSASKFGDLFTPEIRPCDLLIRVNGVCGADAMLAEIRRCPETLALTLERHTGSTSPHSDDSPVFHVDARIDNPIVQATERVQWHALLEPEEGVLAARLVECQASHLESALKRIYTAGDECPVKIRYGCILEDGETKLQEMKDAGQSGEPNTLALTTTSIQRPSTAQEGRRKKEDSASTLRQAMADIHEDEELLGEAVQQFSQELSASGFSSEGSKLMTRARDLLALWKLRRSCYHTRAELRSALAETARRLTPPHDLERLRLALERALPYGGEVTFECSEAQEVIARLMATNQRFGALRAVQLALADPKEDEAALSAALDGAVEASLDETLIFEGRAKLKEWRMTHGTNALHDELLASVQALRRHVDNRDAHGPGDDEQQRVRQAITAARLPVDHHLVREAAALLKRWEITNVTYQAKTRLHNAMLRALRGYSPDQNEVGELLTEAIAEASQQGVDVKYLGDARHGLMQWEAARLRRSRNELQMALRYKDEDFLKEALAMARTAGVEQEDIVKGDKYLLKLQAEEEVNEHLQGAMELAELEPLEQAIRQAHDGSFVEAENPMLESATLQYHLRFWLEEFNQVVLTGQVEGLPHSVDTALQLLSRCEYALRNIRLDKKVPSVASRCLESDMRSVQLKMPQIQSLADVSTAENELKRVLGAVERYAGDLPEVIRQGKKQVDKGLKEELLKDAQEHLEAYTQTVEVLKNMCKDDSTSGIDLKAALIKARLAGAPEDLIERAMGRLEVKDRNLWQATEVELELEVALREADDIGELSAQGRFLRVQGAFDAIKSHKLVLPDQVQEEVDSTSMALAAEQTLAAKIAESEDVLAGRRCADADEVMLCMEELRRACTGADASAQDEAKEVLLPRAELLAERLEVEADERKQLMQAVQQVMNARAATTREVQEAVIAAREACVPEGLLVHAYAKIRKKKLQVIPNQLQEALQQGHGPVAVGLWLRGVALQAREERNGGDWNRTFEAVAGDTSENYAATIPGELSEARCGGSFGTNTWRQNPYFMIRARDHIYAPPSVTVVLAEGSQYPATLAVHVVRNGEQAAAAGFGSVLVPGFEVLASSSFDDDIPQCSFDLPPHDDARPVFIVPSAAKGEYGSFSVVVDSSEPIEIEEVSDAPKELWTCEQTIDLEWASCRPHIVTMGGGRPVASAPPLSWYRNPQFRVTLGKPRPGSKLDPFLGTTTSSLGRSRALVRRESQQDPAEEASKSLPLEPTVYAKLMDIFDQCDRSGDGTINKRELIKCCRKNEDVAKFFGLPKKIRQEDGSREKMEGLFQAMDQNEDRTINMDEFVNFFKYTVQGEPRPEDVEEDDAPLAFDRTLTTGSVMEVEQPRQPLLLVRLVPAEGRTQAPAAVHLVRNSDSALADWKLVQNFNLHQVVASSNVGGQAYAAASEVGAVCMLSRDEEGSILVVPSLETTSSEGRYILELKANEEITVERLA